MKHLWLILLISFEFVWTQELNIKMNDKTAIIAHNQLILIVSLNYDDFIGRFQKIEDDNTVLEQEPLEGVANDGQLTAYKHSGFWQCMDTLKEKEYIFHAGTSEKNNKIYSNAGRVLNIIIRSKDFKNCRTRAIELINEIDWQNGFYRKDIGYKVVD